VYLNKKIKRVDKMRDMTKILIRTILGIIAFFVIIIVFAFNYESGEDKGKIKKDQERMVQHIIKNVELQNKEEIKNIKVKDFKKNNTTGSWSSILEINGEFEIMLKEDHLGGEIRVAFYNSNDMKLDNNKEYKEKDVKIKYYG
jgi:hypothetical protein